ncbi:insulin-like growth factor I [Micropterus salmoides]|uniref:insulin-like growth factor I n=1 Tax=Micropterus salmoides TaxID=27706 RepID=UPI0018EBD7AE|nr:insulin-like growth factor I [Micropterus salmoides]XP_045911807.1 insulin-like growth factor I [Micropterus dolomieu]
MSVIMMDIWLQTQQNMFIPSDSMLKRLISGLDEMCEATGRKLRRCGPPPLLLPGYKTAGLLKSVLTDRMHSSCCPTAKPQTLKVLCVRVCMFYCTMSLAGWPLSSEAARLRCGTDLLSDLIFVCGDRGIYVGKGTWSGYGARPRGKGIVDQCCRPSGCELQHLEMYCAKPKSQQHTTAQPATTTAPHTTTQLDTQLAQQFKAVFQKRLLEHLGAPDSPKREAYRRKTQPSPRRKSKAPSSRRRITTTSRPPSSSLQRTSSES